MADVRPRGALLWLLVLLGGLLGGALGYVAAGSLAPRTSSSEVLVLGLFTDPTFDSALTANQYVTQRMITYGALARSDLVTEAAAGALGIPPEELDGSITAVVVPESAVIEVQVSATSPEEAQRRNEAVTQALSDAIVTSETPAGQPTRVQLTTVSVPSLPEPALVSRPVAGVVGAVVGLLAGILAMLSARRADRRRRRAAERYPLGPPQTGPPLPGGPPPPPAYPPSPGARRPRPRPAPVGETTQNLAVGQPREAGHDR